MMRLMPPKKGVSSVVREKILWEEKKLSFDRFNQYPIPISTWFQYSSKGAIEIQEHKPICVFVSPRLPR